MRWKQDASRRESGGGDRRGRTRPSLVRRRSRGEPARNGRGLGVGRAVNTSTEVRGRVHQLPSLSAIFHHHARWCRVVQAASVPVFSLTARAQASGTRRPPVEEGPRAPGPKTVAFFGSPPASGTAVAAAGMEH